MTAAELDETDIRVLNYIRRIYKELCKESTYPDMVAVGLRNLYNLRGLERREVWTSLSRLVLAKKIESVGSHRYKSYKPLEETRV